MASGSGKMRCGSVIGTGALIEVRGVEFTPRHIKLLNVTAAASAEWVEGMADASMFLRVTAGDATIVTSQAITPQADGFDIGTNADVNTAAELIRWVAWE